MCGWKDKRKRGKGNVFRELVWVAMVALQECTRKVALRFSFEVALVASSAQFLHLNINCWHTENSQNQLFRTATSFNTLPINLMVI